MSNKINVVIKNSKSKTEWTEKWTAPEEWEEDISQDYVDAYCKTLVAQFNHRSGDDDQREFVSAKFIPEQEPKFCTECDEEINEDIGHTEMFSNPFLAYQKFFFK